MESNETKLITASDDTDLTVAQMKTLVSAGIVPQGTSTSQIKIFAQVCKSKDLSPFSKEIYLVGYGGKYSVITGIDGFRKMAIRTGDYAGKDNPKFNMKADGSFQTAYEVNKPQNIHSCTVTIYRMVQGNKCPFTATVMFKEFSSGKQKWASMPFQMISKVAEVHALKMAFGDVFSGIHSNMEEAAFNNAQEAETLN